MPESIYNSEFSASPPPSTGTVVALGNFDGVHRGHQTIIRTALEQATRLGGIPVRIITFEPHPQTIFRPEGEPFRLSSPQDKRTLLQKTGAIDVFVINFTPEFSRMPPQPFVSEILVKDHKARHVVVGSNFVFGYQRAGNVSSLKNLLFPFGTDVTEVMPCRDVSGEILSSSRTRDALRDGDVELAAHILGRPWSISGTIRHSTRQIGPMDFSVAYLSLQNYVRPKDGIYAIFAHKEGNPQRYAGMARVGGNPVLNPSRKEVEFHLFDYIFDDNLVKWEIELIKFIRPESTFSDEESRRFNIIADVDVVRNALSTTTL